MKSKYKLSTNKSTLHAVVTGLTMFILFLIAASHEVSAQSIKASPLINASQDIINRAPNSVLNQQIIECNNESYCQQLVEQCIDSGQCFTLISYCFENGLNCRALFRHIACEMGNDEQCDEIPECREDDEDCEEIPECREDDEDCDEIPECRDDDEDCDEIPECREDDEDCQSNDICTDEEEQECDAVVTTGFENTNPVSEKQLQDVTAEQAQGAARFLTQATLGANYALVTKVASSGEAEWLETQFQQPIGYLFPQIDYLTKKIASFENEEMEEVYGDPLELHLHAWWTQVMTSPDLVRQRVAMALSEIFVISSNVEIIGESPFVISQYYDTLLKNSFGNFRDLLKDISLNPAMAIYLSHMNNEKANQETGTFPDENYAREVMQLFSIGLFELNADGTRKKDSQGNDIPTYGQQQIREFAKIFTGLSMDNPEEGFGAVPCCNEDFYLHASTMKPLKMYDAHHSPGEKHLLNGTIVPAGQTGIQDIDMAIDNLFNHPNVGPFIGKQLIQRLVTSNPSPAYVSRVTAAFNGEQTGVRGDMKATIRAILMDPEARAHPEQHSNQFGKLREPFLRLVRLARTFDASTPDRNFAGDEDDILGQIKQYVFSAPSVFNFFQPTYSPNGELKDAGLAAPEFQITNGVTIIEIKNLIHHWVETGQIGERVGYLSPVEVSFEHELSLVNDNNALLNHLDTVMTYGTLSANTRNAIYTVLEGEPSSLERVKKAVFLIAISPDFAIAL